MVPPMTEEEFDIKTTVTLGKQVAVSLLFLKVGGRPTLSRSNSGDLCSHLASGHHL